MVPEFNQTDRNQTDRNRTGPERHPRSKGFPSWIMDQGSRIKDHGSLIKDQRSSIKDQRSTIMYHGSSTKDQGSWTLDLVLAWMTILEGIYTDVRSRPFESIIKDLSFYIGFTRIQSSVRHLGPCFGMNGHSRRDPDMISRLPDTTNHFLSAFIGFRLSLIHIWRCRR